MFMVNLKVIMINELNSYLNMKLILRMEKVLIRVSKMR